MSTPPTPSPTLSPEKEHILDAANLLIFSAVIMGCVVCGYMLKRSQFHYLPRAVRACFGDCHRGHNQARYQLRAGTLPRLIPSRCFLLRPPSPNHFPSWIFTQAQAIFLKFEHDLNVAFGGTLISTFVVGFLTYAVAKAVADIS